MHMPIVEYVWCSFLRSTLLVMFDLLAPCLLAIQTTQVVDLNQ